MELTKSRLRLALSQHFDERLTPEVCAHIEAIAIANPMPVPAVPAGSDLIVDLQPKHFDFVHQALNSKYDPATVRGIAREDVDGRIKGVVLFRDGNHNVEMAVASDHSAHWLSRTMLRAVFAYPFIQLAKCRVTALIRANNVKAICFDRALGFVHEGRLADYFGPDDDAIVMGMRRANCAWIDKER